MRDACRDAPTGDADAVANEQVAVAAGDVVEVEVAVVQRPAGERAHAWSAPGADHQLGEAAGQLVVLGIGEAGRAQHRRPCCSRGGR